MDDTDQRLIAELRRDGRAALSAEMAIRIEKAFGVSMETLMRMQNSYDIAQARKREGEIDVAPFKGTADGMARILLAPSEFRTPTSGESPVSQSSIESRMAMIFPMVFSPLSITSNGTSYTKILL